MKVLAWGREGSRARAQADGIEVAASQDALFRDADVLSLHIALTGGDAWHRFGRQTWQR